MTRESYMVCLLYCGEEIDRVIMTASHCAMLTCHINMVSDQSRGGVAWQDEYICDYYTVL